MQTAELSAKLRAWTLEFVGISAEPVQVPDNYFLFLSNRLIELGVVEEDPDVIVALVGNGWRKVRITGKRGPRLSYDLADGSRGMGLIEMRHVHAESRSKLTDIIERMVADGRISA